MISPSAILNARILIVDDRKANVLLLQRILGDAGYVAVSSTTAPQEVCHLHQQDPFDLIVLDIQMPDMDGFEVMEGLTKIELEGYLPVLVVTSQPDHKMRALTSGAVDFISRPFDFAEVLARVRNTLNVRLLQKQLHNFNDELEQKVQERTAELQAGYVETIFAMTRVAEHRHQETGFHLQRIGHYSRELAMLLGRDEKFVEQIFFASLLHDVGQIGIPDHVLLDAGEITPAHWDLLKSHTSIGANILGSGRSPFLQMGAEIALNHHERWDGGGYPNGKQGEAIPLSARIMHLCDVYDALRRARPYKPRLGHREAMDIITYGDDRTQPGSFDPVVLAAFKENHETFRAIFDKYPD